MSAGGKNDGDPAIETPFNGCRPLVGGEQPKQHPKPAPAPPATPCGCPPPRGAPPTETGHPPSPQLEATREARAAGQRGGEENAAVRLGEGRCGRGGTAEGTRSGRPVHLLTMAFLAAEEARLGGEQRRPGTAPLP
jgi:hypothetical protein